MIVEDGPSLRRLDVAWRIGRLVTIAGIVVYLADRFTDFLPPGWTTAVVSAVLVVGLSTVALAYWSGRAKLNR